MNKTYVSKSVRDVGIGNDVEDRSATGNSIVSGSACSGKRFRRGRAVKPLVAKVGELHVTLVAESEPVFLSPSSDAVENEASNQNPKIVKTSFRGWSWLILISLIVLAVIVFFRKIVEVLIWSGYSVLLAVLVFVILSVLCFGAGFCWRLWRAGRKKYAALTFFILSASSLSIGVNQYFNFNAQKPEYEEAIRGGTEKYLSPLSEHYEFTFNDGSRLYYKPERLISMPEIDKSWYKFALPAIEDKRHFDRLEGAVDFRAVIGAIWRRLTEPQASGPF